MVIQNDVGANSPSPGGAYRMNYFAHGRRYVDDPYFLAGTAVPDWLNVVDRRVRVRASKAQRFADDQDATVAALARGILQHHRDDDWFHRTRAFTELSWQFTASVREVLPADDGLRPSFLGHILVELLLDAELIEEAPQRLNAYYRAVQSLDPAHVELVVGTIARQPAERLGEFIGRFCAVRFLSDYAEDDKLLYRLNQVMGRVKLPRLPADMLAVFPEARTAVRSRKAELLAGELT